MEHARQQDPEVPADRPPPRATPPAPRRAPPRMLLVVMGKRGRGGALRGRLGSVSNAVAAHSPVPVIVGSRPGRSRRLPRTRSGRAPSAGGTGRPSSPTAARRASASRRTSPDRGGGRERTPPGREPRGGPGHRVRRVPRAGARLVTVNGALSGTPESGFTGRLTRPTT
ncbi:universal stress protein [Kocuria rhizophila]|nr:universal stress protein [Kocuria rhizophila]